VKGALVTATFQVLANPVNAVATVTRPITSTLGNIKKALQRED
jgi:hypothetical protein